MNKEKWYEELLEIYKSQYPNHALEDTNEEMRAYINHELDLQLRYDEIDKDSITSKILKNPSLDRTITLRTKRGKIINIFSSGHKNRILLIKVYYANSVVDIFRPFYASEKNAPLTITHVFDQEDERFVIEKNFSGNYKTDSYMAVVGTLVEVKSLNETDFKRLSHATHVGNNPVKMVYSVHTREDKDTADIQICNYEVSPEHGIRMTQFLSGWYYGIPYYIQNPKCGVIPHIVVNKHGAGILNETINGTFECEAIDLLADIAHNAEATRSNNVQAISFGFIPYEENREDTYDLTIPRGRSKGISLELTKKEQ